MNLKPELKNCSFCGAVAVGIDGYHRVDHKDDCFISENHGDRTIIFKTEHDAWNTRAPDSLVKELVEALEDILASNSGGRKACGHDFTCVCAFDKAQAALAKAKEGM